jgi:hypothetical protein
MVVLAATLERLLRAVNDKEQAILLGEGQEEANVDDGGRTINAEQQQLMLLRADKDIRN